MSQTRTPVSPLLQPHTPRSPNLPENLRETKTPQLQNSNPKRLLVCRLSHTTSIRIATWFKPSRTKWKATKPARKQKIEWNPAIYPLTSLCLHHQGPTEENWDMQDQTEDRHKQSSSIRHRQRATNTDEMQGTTHRLRRASRIAAMATSSTNG
jgi:hypothetical protein